VRDAIARARASLAEVLVGSPLSRSGTGFAVSTAGLIVTCDHVVADATNVVVNIGGSRYPATVVARNRAADVALLRAEAQFQVLPLGSIEQVQVGDEVLWGGFPLDSWLPSWHKGMVSFVGDVTPNGVRGVQLDGTVNLGNSGGPVIDPNSGAAIGIVSSRMGNLSDRLADDLQKLRYVGGGPGRGSAGITMSVNGVIVDPTATLAEAIQHMARSMQLGVGYGVSSEYIAQLCAGVYP